MAAGATIGGGGRDGAAGGDAPPRTVAQRLLGDHPTAWLFIAPAVIVIIGLAIVPIVWSVVLSFKSARPDHGRRSGSGCTTTRRCARPRPSATRSSTRSIYTVALRPDLDRRSGCCWRWR